MVALPVSVAEGDPELEPGAGALDGPVGTTADEFVGLALVGSTGLVLLPEGDADRVMLSAVDEDSPGSLYQIVRPSPAMYPNYSAQYSSWDKPATGV